MPGSERTLPGSHLLVSMQGAIKRCCNGSPQIVQKAAWVNKLISRKPSATSFLDLGEHSGHYSAE